MGSTYSVGKRAAALAGPDGTIYYALFEETYESNVYPHHPCWSAIYFGTAQACMDRIIWHAEYCEGGMTKEEGGNTTPSAYIKHWREAMSNPTELSGEWTEASFGNGIYVLDPAMRPQIEAVLHTHSHPGPDGDKVRVNFRKQPELMHALVDVGAYAWRFFGPRQCTSIPAEWAAYSPKLVSGLIPTVTIWSIADRPDAEHWIQSEGRMRKAGWAYSTVEYLIDDFARPSEREHPGSAEATIREIRKLMKKVRPMPMETVVRVERAKGGEKWDLRTFDQLAAKLGCTGQEIATTVGAILRADAVYEFKSLPDAMVAFDGLPAVSKPGEQQALGLAA